ncbi:MAG: hypothetical protein DRQ88_00775 [Epsilonproteobacteria bacterium]|nr:MAG: hypothetical protein DRQ89_10310 [Campylobacterota bacterium]RLA68168.1 MAG: hypothetical protein DRQ88_00775 [Campylobacterota bacterium]
MRNKKLSIFYIKTPRDLGVAIRRIRKNKGLTQLDVANSVNMRQPTVSDVENGRGTFESLFKIVQALKINLGISTGDIAKQKKSKKSKAQELLDLL